VPGTTSARETPHSRISCATDPAWYLAQNPDVAEAGIDPFGHYVEYGRAEGRLPRAAHEIIAESGLFDPNHYLIAGPDVRESGLNPIDHFCRFGWREGRRANVYFNTPWYRAVHLATWPDLNPLCHYILEGEAAGFRPVAWFDPAWYRATYNVPAGTSPLGHFLVHRRSQQFSPNPKFDVAWYMARHGVKIGPNRDPFAHYLRNGAVSDIDPSPGFDAAAYRRQHMGRPSRHFGADMPPELQNPLVHYLSATYAPSAPLLTSGH